MKKVLALCLMLAMVFTAGCAEDTAKEPVSISSATSFGGDAANAAPYAELLSTFTTNHPNITVNDESAKADDSWKELIRSRFESDQEPDVMFYFSKADVRTMIESGKLVSIDTIRAEYPDYCKNIKQEALDNMVEYDGKTYAVPVMGFWEGLYYNKELFQKYSVPEITDWNSLIHAVEVFSAGNVVPIAASFADVPNYWIEHSILAAGGVSTHSANPKATEELPPEWSDGLSLIADLYKKKAFQPDCLSTRNELAVDLYNKGEAAMLLEGSWLSFPREIEEVTRVARFPALASVESNDTGVIAGFSMGFYISQKAWDDPAKRDACVKFVEHMTTNESVGMLCVQGAPAADIATSNESQIVNDGIDMCNKNKMELPIDSRLSKSAWEYLSGKITSIASGDSNVKEVLSRAVELNK